MGMAEKLLTDFPQVMCVSRPHTIFLVFIKGNSSGSSFKPVYVVTGRHFFALPQKNHLLMKVPAGGALLGSARGTKCKRGDESAECGSPQPLTFPRPMLRLSLHRASSLTCRECGLRISPRNCSALGQPRPVCCTCVPIQIQPCPEGVFPAWSTVPWLRV